MAPNHGGTAAPFDGAIERPVYDSETSRTNVDVNETEGEREPWRERDEALSPLADRLADEVPLAAEFVVGRST